MAYSKTTYYTIRDSARGSLNRNNLIYSGVKAGEKVDGWRLKLKEGRDATSNYSIDAWRMLDSKPAKMEYIIHYVNRQGVSSQSFGWNLDGFWKSVGQNGKDHLTSQGPNDNNQALNRLYGKIISYRQGMNGLQFLGELREAVRMLKNPAEALRTNVSKYLSTLETQSTLIKRQFRQKKSESNKQFRSRKANALKNGMAGSWLELQFGLKPLVNDVQAIAVTILERSEPRFARSKFTGTSDPQFAELLLIDANDDVPSGTNGCVRIDVKFTATTHASYRWSAGFKRKVTFAGLAPTRSLAEDFGLVLENFVPTAWELLPWSWLIDYFVNIGDILQAASVDQSGLIYAHRTNRKHTLWECQETFGGYSYGADNWNVAKMSGDNSSLRKFERTTFSRSKQVGGLPIPDLTFSIPGIDKKNRYLNMASVLAQRKNFHF